MDVIRKQKTISLRISSEDYEAYKAKALKEGITLSTLMTKVMDSYLNNDTNIQSQLLASNTQLRNELNRMRKELLVLTNTIDALSYSFFCAFPSYFQKEFEDGTTTASAAHAAAQNRQLADKIKTKWMQKLAARKQVSLAITAKNLEVANEEVAE